MAAWRTCKRKKNCGSKQLAYPSSVSRLNCQSYRQIVTPWLREWITVIRWKGDQFMHCVKRYRKEINMVTIQWPKKSAIFLILMELPTIWYLAIKHVGALPKHVRKSQFPSSHDAFLKADHKREKIHSHSSLYIFIFASSSFRTTDRIGGPLLCCITSGSWSILALREINPPIQIGIILMRTLWMYPAIFLCADIANQNIIAEQPPLQAWPYDHHTYLFYQQLFVFNTSYLWIAVHLSNS